MAIVVVDLPLPTYVVLALRASTPLVVASSSTLAVPVLALRPTEPALRPTELALRLSMLAALAGSSFTDIVAVALLFFVELPAPTLAVPLPSDGGRVAFVAVLVAIFACSVSIRPFDFWRATSFTPFNSCTRCSSCCFVSLPTTATSAFRRRHSAGRARVRARVGARVREGGGGERWKKHAHVMRMW